MRLLETIMQIMIFEMMPVSRIALLFVHLTPPLYLGWQKRRSLVAAFKETNVRISGCHCHCPLGPGPGRSTQRKWQSGPGPGPEHT